MKQYTINKIKQDLKKLNLSLDKDVNNLSAMIKNLQKNRPYVKIDKSFKQDLAKKLDYQIKNKNNRISILQILSSKKFTTAIISCIMIVICIYILQPGKNPATIADNVGDNTEKTKDSLVISEKNVNENFRGHGFNPEGPAGAESATSSEEYKKGKERIAGNSSKLGKSKSGHIFYQPMKLAGKRMLEYSVNLYYETENFSESRQKLLAIISEYGFIINNTSSTTGKALTLNSTFYIQKKDLYKTLQKFDALGTLRNEQIVAIDHTAGIVWKNIQIEREQLRIKRKRKTIRRVPEAYKTWTYREESLEASENALDTAKFEKWKLNDQIKWAQINLQLQGPVLPETIQVPMYINAITNLINIALKIAYTLIQTAPLILIFIIIWIKRNSIKKIFTKKD